MYGSLRRSGMLASLRILRAEQGQAVGRSKVRLWGESVLLRVIQEGACRRVSLALEHGAKITTSVPLSSTYSGLHVTNVNRPYE